MAGWILPAELTSLIFDFVGATGPLGPCAAVCSQWQILAEQYTFSKIKLSQSLIEDFCNYVRGRRRRFLVEITLFSDDKSTEEEADMVEPLQKLFQYISSWRGCEVNTRGIRLIIDGLKTSSLLKSRAEEPGWNLLEQPEMTLPLVPAIKSLEIDRLMGSQAWIPVYCTHLIMRLLRLESFTMKKVCCEHKAWNVFIENISYWPSSIRSLNLAMVDLTVKRTYPIESSSFDDSLGRNLHHFSKQLKHIDISACTWTELFTPSTPPPTTDQPNADHMHRNSNSQIDPEPYQWPLLETLVLRYDDITPAGQDLYICGRDAQTIHDRTALDEKLMNELYLAAAQAALGMPRLRRMQLGPKGFNGWTHRFTYEVNDVWTGAPAVAARWESRLEYEPSVEVIEAWRRVARAHARVELQVLVDGK